MKLALSSSTSSSEPSLQPTRGTPWVDGLVLGVVFLVFLPALGGGLIWDDRLLLDPAHLSQWREALFSPYLPGKDLLVSPYYRPVSTLFLAAENGLYGQSAFFHHLTSLFLHLLCTLSVMRLTRRLFPAWPPGPGAAAPRGPSFSGHPWFAPGVGVLFGLHPVHVEPVAWISGRPDLLAALFTLLACLCLVPRAEGPELASTRIEMTNGQGRELAQVALGAFLLLLGLLSKEAAISLPLALLGMWNLGRSPVSPRALGLRLGALAVAIGVFMLLRQHALQASNRNILELGGTSWEARFGTALRSVAASLEHFLLPLQLCAEWEIPRNLPLMTGETLVGAGILLVTGILRLRSRGPEALGLVWCMAFLLPVLNLYPIDETVAERYLYLPSVGLCWVVAGVWARGWSVVRSSPPQSPWLQRLGVGGLVTAGAGLVLFWTLQTVQGIPPWASELDFFSHQVACAPDSARANGKLGEVYRRLQEPVKARAQWEKALELEPNNSHTLNLLAQLELEEQKPEMALEKVQRSLGLQPDSVPALLLLGRIQLSLGRADAALETLETALKLDPERPETLYDLGVLQFRQGNIAAMQRSFERLLILQGPSALVLNYLGIGKMAQGAEVEGIQYFRQATVLESGFSEAHCNLARALVGMGDVALLSPDVKTEALRALQVCLEAGAGPDWAKVLERRLKAQGEAGVTPTGVQTAPGAPRALTAD